MKSAGKKYLKIIFFLSLIGIILSSYLLNLHYIDAKKPCDINDTLSCSKVSQSIYSELFGIPVSLLGIFGYLWLGLLSMAIYNGWDVKFNLQRYSKKVLAAITVSALLFSLYLTYTEFFLIKAFCILCLFSQAVILVIVWCAYKYLKIDKHLKIDKQTEMM